MFLTKNDVHQKCIHCLEIGKKRIPHRKGVLFILELFLSFFFFVTCQGKTPRCGLVFIPVLLVVAKNEDWPR